MSVVFAAEDLRHRRRVAIKVMKPQIGESLGTERFLREIEVAAGFSHPHILPLHDSGEADGLLWFAMPFVEGETLRERLDREGPLDLDEALRITREVAGALDHAHAQGMLHRDVKPGNILFQAGHAVVGDFGIARALIEAGREELTGTGVAIGTLKYMSPEQATAEGPLDERTDVYALGCVLYEMLVGDAPFAPGSAQAVLARKLTQAPPDVRTARPDVPLSVATVLDQALARDPNQRFPAPGELAAALSDASSAEARLRAERRAAGRRRHRTAAFAAAFVGLAAGGWWLASELSSPTYELLAVLPPTDLTGDPEQSHLVTGVHDGLISELAGAGVRMIARSSVMQFADGDTPVRDIAETLGAGAVVEVTFNRIADSVRLDVRLVDGVTEELVWFSTYGGDVGDVPTLFREATSAIIDEIGFDVSADMADRLAASAEVDPVAYDAYLRGITRMESFAPEQGELALLDFERALEADPDFALPYTGISQVWGQRRVLGLVAPAEAEPHQRAALARALELDSMNAQVHAGLAQQSFGTDRDFVASEAAYRRALEINPSNVRALTFYSQFLTAMGRADEASQYIERALELDPVNVFTQAMYGSQLALAARYEESLVQLDEAVRRLPALAGFANWIRMGSLYQLGRREESVQVFAGFFNALGDEEAASTLTRASAEGGPDRAFVAIGDLLATRSEDRFVRPMQVAHSYARGGRFEEAFAWVERGFEVNDHEVPWIGAAPWPEEIRADPRFEAALRRAGLPVEPFVRR